MKVSWWGLLTGSDLYVKEIEEMCPSLIAESIKKDFVDENRVLKAEE